MEDMQELATALHRTLCHLSHMDQCGWEYEEDDWTKSAHKYYLEKAEKLSGRVMVSVPAIISVIDAMGGCNGKSTS